MIFSHGKNPPSRPLRLQDKMVGATSIIKGFFANFPMLILPKIGRNMTRESLIELHRLINRNASSMASNLGGSRNGNLTLTMTTEDYMAHTGYAFFHLITPETNLQQWGPPKRNHLETKGSDKIKHFSEDAPPWTERLKNISSWRCNRSSCSHWWNS